MKKLPLLLAFVFLFSLGRGIAQTAVQSTAPVDTVNLAKRPSLSGEDFKLVVNKYIASMERKVTYRTYDDYIILVRLFNTIEESAKYQKQEWVPLNKITVKDFYALFRWNYMDATIKQLAFEKRSSGVGYYSAYFKLGIGLTEPPKEADFYQVVWK